MKPDVGRSETPQITVCIAAYKAGAFIGETVASALAQTHADLICEIAIDPPADGSPDQTEAALEPFHKDPRVKIRVNPVRLGWAGNFAALADRVRTDFFAFLPHDDLWHPTYLDRLVTPLLARPQASVCYCDLEQFGAGSGGKAVVLPDGESRAKHVLRFCLQGAQGMLWRGVTRRSALAVTGGFPTDGYQGFAVECEYALALLAAGQVIHIAEPLYSKRVFKADVMSASRERVAGVPEDVRLAAWQNHDRQMTNWLAAAMAASAMPADMAVLCRAALDAAMLRRRQSMVTPVMDEAALERLETAMRAVDGSSAEEREITSQLTRIYVNQLKGL
jgi:hypothetical protein